MHVQPTADNVSQVFIGGYGHSGTSLFATILDRHPAIHRAVGEVKIIERLPVIRREHPLSTQDDFDEFFRACVAASELGAPHNAFPVDSPHPYTEAEIPDGWDDVPKNHVDIFFWALDRLAAADGASLWLAKSMSNTIFSDVLFERFPDAKFLIIVRDPRDVLASKKTRVQMVSKKFSGEQLARKRLEKKYSPLLDAWSWASQNKADRRLQAARPGQVLMVRYEAVVGDPEPTLAKVCEFLGLAFDPQMLQVTFSNSADMKERPAGIYQNSGRFRTALTGSEIAFLQLVLREPLRHFDYAPVALTPADRITSVRYFVTGAWDLVDRLLARFRLLGWNGFRAYVANAARKLPGLDRMPTRGVTAGRGTE